MIAIVGPAKARLKHPRVQDCLSEGSHRGRVDTDRVGHAPYFPQMVQPVTRPKPVPEVPPGWVVAPPDFVGVGAGRCGTSWWWRLLSQHPAVARPNRYKEVHFFDHYLDVTEVEPQSYHRYFPRPPGMLAGEWTPLYMYDFWTPPMLRMVAPDARLLVMLRDPVERYLSGLAFIRARGFPVNQAMLHYQYERSLYGQQFATLLAHFPREQVLVLQYERCAAEPLRELRRTCEFIGADATGWRPAQSPAELVNQSAAEKPQLPAATQAALGAALRADAAVLGRLLPELDLSLWRTLAAA